MILLLKTTKFTCKRQAWSVICGLRVLSAFSKSSTITVIMCNYKGVAQWRETNFLNLSLDLPATRALTSLSVIKNELNNGATKSITICLLRVHSQLYSMTDKFYMKNMHRFRYHTFEPWITLFYHTYSVITGLFIISVIEHYIWLWH